MNDQQPENDYLTDDEKQSIIDAVYGNPGDRSLGTQRVVERIVRERMEALVLHICWERFDCSREWAECDHGSARALVFPPGVGQDEAGR